jgi:Prp8 binding protein
MDPVKKFRKHTACVNSFDVASNELLASGSDDSTVKVWDQRAKEPVHAFEFPSQVTSVQFSLNSEIVFVGGVDNSIHALNLKTQQVEYSLYGHKDTVTGLRLSHNGKFLLSNSVDHTLKIWNV